MSDKDADKDDANTKRTGSDPTKVKKPKSSSSTKDKDGKDTTKSRSKKTEGGSKPSEDELEKEKQRAVKISEHLKQVRDFARSCLRRPPPARPRPSSRELALFIFPRLLLYYCDDGFGAVEQSSSN